jgi:hypothetical protein
LVVEYRLGVESGAGQEYLVVAAVSETLDMVAKMKREIEPDKGRIRALREKVEKVFVADTLLLPTCGLTGILNSAVRGGEIDNGAGGPQL